MNKKLLKPKKPLKQGKKLSTEELNKVAGGNCSTTNPNPPPYCLRPADTTKKT